MMDGTAALLLASAGCILAGGFAALAHGRSFSACLVLRAVMVPASLLGFAAACAALYQGGAQSIAIPFPLPLGACLFQVDALSAFFLIPVFLLSALAALVLPARVGPVDDSLHCGRHCFFFSLLSSGMALVIMAADGIFFLLLWEIMSLAPFFLLAGNDKNATERFAGWIYLVAAHLGALPLLLLFASLTMQADSSSFSAYMAQPSWQHGGLLFALAVVGFGTKSGLFPLHMWMPEAHSSAPGHVAVLLSGTMLNVGLYGIMRVLCLLGGGGREWACALMLLGAFSGILGILAGLVQSDMKRTLAYSSAENMGIILLAFGGALLAAHHGANTAVTLLLFGAFLHIWNHSVFKSLLFLGANAVKEHTHSTGIHRLGGLFKRIPFTGGCFAAGCAAIAGVPPLNGFMGELLMYLGFLLGAESTTGSEASLIFWVAFFVLGTIAGFALFAFARLFGLAFLGAPRSTESLEAREPDRTLKGALLLLALLCFGISLAGPLLLALFSSLLRFFESARIFPAAIKGHDFAASVIGGYAAAALAVALLLALALLLRRRAVERTGSRDGATWGCGYSAPSPRMQYTGGSFAHSVSLLLRPLIRPKIDEPTVKGLFPGAEKAVMTTPDWPTAAWTRLLFRPVALLAEQAKNLQHGLLNVYILYILVALMAALVWALGWT